MSSIENKAIKNTSGKVVRAIDLGYGNTKFTESIGEDGVYNFGHFPSTAPKAARIDIAESMNTTRKTVLVDVEGVTYEVGPDSKLALGTKSNRVLHEDYINHPQYMALTKGALHYMNVDSIDILIVGLPVTLLPKREKLIEMMTGTHKISDTKTVTVKKTIAVPQPLGGLLSYSSSEGEGGLAETKGLRNLIIDAGYFTLDWLYSIGFQPNENRSGDTQAGMSKILEAVSVKIGENFEVPNYDDLDTVDEGMTNGMARIYGQKHEFGQYEKVWHAIAKDGITTMVNKVGDGKDVEQIILCGGGAKFYKKAVEEAFPRHKDSIIVLDDSILSNVKGFQFLGELKA